MQQYHGPPFPILELPPELVDLVVANLDISTLRAARFVSRQWREYATRRLYRTITMTPTNKGLRQ